MSGYTWGYMPYQCGAWNWYNSFGWGWAPGGCRSRGGAGGGWYFQYRIYAGMVPAAAKNPHPPRPRPTPLPIIRTGPTVRPRIGMRPIAPVIAVRREDPGGPGILPPREVGHPIRIGGVVAQPLKPTAPRQGFGRGPVTAGPISPNPVRTFYPGGSSGGPFVPGRQGYAAPPVAGAPRPVYPAPVQRPVYSPVQQPGAPGGVWTPGSVPAPRAPSVPVYRPAPAPAPRPSGGGAPRARTGSCAGSASGSGGGGGGSHPAGSPA